MLTHNVFQNFVDQLNESQDNEAFRVTMAEAAAAFDLPSFAYARMPTQSEQPVTLISTYPPTWTDHYLRSHYEVLDPVINASYRRIEPFEWGEGADGFELTNRQREFFDEASSFGIRCGFTIPIQDGRGPVAAVTFASSGRRKGFVRTIRKNAGVLQLMAIALHAHARRKLWYSTVVGGKQLSGREMECLSWAAKGKSAWATARILGISDATVKFHLGNVRKKFNVTSLRQAIAMLSRPQTR